MSVGAESGIDWRELEKQFYEGGNNNRGSGGGDEGGDGWKPERPDNNDMSFGVFMGSLGGGFVGMLAGAVVTGEYDDWSVNRYIAKNHIVTTPSSRPAIENSIYDKATNKNVELGLILGPMIVVAAIGAVMGKRIENKFSS